MFRILILILISVALASCGEQQPKHRIWCTEQSQCSMLTFYPKCIECVCQDPEKVVTCRGMADCPEGEICVNNICSKCLINCTKDADCPKDLGCHGCKCQFVRTIDCKTDSACLGGGKCINNKCDWCQPPSP
jgi:hypothetical protein